MKLTCLSKGSGYYYPPSHILDLAGHRILLECPLDLSPLSSFSPPNLQPRPHDLVDALPRYRTLHHPSLLDLDLVLVSSPPGMLALPFLSRLPTFSAKIYATEATARFGRLLMEELLSMHAEYIGCYGPEEDGEVPAWMRPEMGIVAGEEEEEGEVGSSWLPLYSAEDLEECLKKVRCVKYGEHCCHNGSLILKAFSSGLEIGASNWTLCSPGRNIAYLSSSVLRSSHAASFNYQDLQGSDVIIFSDFSSLYTMDISGKIGSEYSNSFLMGDTCGNINEFIDKLVGSEYTDEQEKMSFICSCVVDSVKAGGSVLIPIGRPGIVLQLVEQISQCLELFDMEVPMYMISSAAEETLAFASAMPEWVSKERQEKLFSAEPLFGHSMLIEEKKLHVFPALHSSSLISIWREPCIVFSPHWTLRLGPSVHLLCRWRGHKDCLLILEHGVDADAVISPFKPLKLKILQCSFPSGILLHKILPLLKVLLPKLVLLPDDLQSLIPAEDTPFRFLFYTPDSTLSVPRLSEDTEALLSTDLVFQLQPKRIPEENVAIARLRGQLSLNHAKFTVVPRQKPAVFSRGRRTYWGSIDRDRLMIALQEKGINASMLSDDAADHEAKYHVLVEGSKSGVVQVSKTQTVISASDETLAAEMYEAVCSALNGI